MRLSSVTYSRTRNLGDYNSARLEATVEVNEGESGAEAIRLAKEFVHKGLGIPVPASPRQGG